ncbi:MAG: ATP-binding protein, partial [Cyanobacteriota bacterium]
MSMAERDRIFEKFYRIPNNDPWKYGGTGLGLALVKKLVMCLQGDLELDCANGQVQFTVTLPLQPEPVP